MLRFYFVLSIHKMQHNIPEGNVPWTFQAPAFLFIHWPVVTYCILRI